MSMANRISVGQQKKLSVGYKMFSSFHRVEEGNDAAWIRCASFLDETRSASEPRPFCNCHSCCFDGRTNDRLRETSLTVLKMAQLSLLSTKCMAIGTTVFDDDTSAPRFNPYCDIVKKNHANV